MVLWISAQDQEILIATSKYFQQPFKSPMEASSGVMTGEGSNSATDAVAESDPSSIADLTLLNKLAQEFYKMLDIEESREDAPVDIEVTNDGLRVTIYNRQAHEVFEPGTAEFTQWGRFLVENVAWLVARNKFKIRVDGHVAAGFVPPRPDYTAWELSADRANAMRRGLQHFAVAGDKFERVTGFGDTVPLEKKNPSERANERVEISLVVLPPLATAGTSPLPTDATAAPAETASGGAH
jgi:chemotaxis protein MotB